MSDLAIRAEHIFKSYGKIKAVDDFSFEVEPSICFGLLGPNGAGKTTMMKMLYAKGIRDKRDDSKLSVFGYDPVEDELAIKAFTGVTPQDNNLDTELNVMKNLMIYARLYGIPRKEARKRVLELLEFMELSEKKKARVDDLSGGMKRRLVLARSLINSPRLLILDEPTTGLDPQVRHLIWDKLRLLKKQGVTILLTTHYMDEAYQIADRIIIMDKGRKIMEGEPATLLRDNIEEYVLEIIKRESADEIEKEWRDEKVRVDQATEMTLLYSNDLDALKRISNKARPGDARLRQSNLEDLFMKTTGRQLNEKQ